MAKRMSLLELCTRAALAVQPDQGVRSRARASGDAGKCCAFVIEWAWYMRDTGTDDPSVEGYAEWAHVSVRTGFYRLALFRKLFGEWHTDPTPLARYVNEWLAEHRDQHPRGATIPASLVTA